MIPPSVEQYVAIRRGTKTSVGLAAPRIARWAKMAIGIIVNPEVLMAKNMIWALLAVSFLGLSCCMLSMALSPIGVAALSKPNILAEKLSSNCPVAGCPGGISGKSLWKNGPTILDKTRMAPAFSPLFIKPNHRVMTPTKGKAISITAILEAENVASMICLNTWASPVSAKVATATVKAIRKKAIQM